MFLLFVAVLVSVSIHFILKKWRQSNLHSLQTGEAGWFGEEEKGGNEECEPFTVRVPEEVLTDLRHRLEIARIPQSLVDTNFEYGFHSDYLREVVNYWKTEYDWRRQEEQLINRYPQFKTKIEGLRVHFIHVKPIQAGERKPRVFPLLVLHGWPGSFVEFYKLIPLLTTERDDQDFVFEVICPSIPGYGFSESPHQKGFGTRAAGRVFKTLMERLGHSKFYVQGGDWGAIIAMNMSKVYPDKILGVHVNYFTFNAFSFSLAAKYILASVCPSFVSPQQYKCIYPFREMIRNMIEATGYFHIQSTRPDTLAYALNDSPVGLAAYILEKFALWTDSTHKYLPDGGLTKKFTLDELLTNVMIYWVNANISSTHRFYKETFNDDHRSDYEKMPIEVPCGITNCVNDLPAPKFFISRNLVKNLVVHSSHDKGGHFLALEEPQLLADDIWKFVRLVEERKISQLIREKLKKK
ncbi:epoxide hydrolase 1 [Parasteatoda tepidariorum]|uniref:epoxide hydrolase 1 n=1 Tax=Parasteatoda tepidariorum TaxID=114398 RepID=UPI001C719F59|nr:epoxide hydrolase 1 [Parasteatoda tepidariorum]